jgi:hypothetical protein
VIQQAVIVYDAIERRKEVIPADNYKPLDMAHFAPTKMRFTKRATVAWSAAKRPLRQ